MDGEITTGIVDRLPASLLRHLWLPVVNYTIQTKQANDCQSPHPLHRMVRSDSREDLTIPFVEGLVSLHEAGEQRPEVEELILYERYIIIISQRMASDQLRGECTIPSVSNGMTMALLLRLRITLMTIQISQPPSRGSCGALLISTVISTSEPGSDGLNGKLRLGPCEDRQGVADRSLAADRAGFIRQAAPHQPHEARITPGLETTMHSMLSTHSSRVFFQCGEASACCCSKRCRMLSGQARVTSAGADCCFCVGDLRGFAARGKLWEVPITSFDSGTDPGMCITFECGCSP